MSTPAFLLVELRQAFRTCRQSSPWLSARAFSSNSLLRKSSGPSNNISASRNSDTSRAPSTYQVSKQTANQTPTSQHKTPETKELVPQRKGRTAVDTGRRTELPMRVLPKAQITPNLTLAPKERLHLEHLTRSLPKRAPAKCMCTLMFFPGPDAHCRSVQGETSHLPHRFRKTKGSYDLKILNPTRIVRCNGVGGTGALFCRFAVVACPWKYVVSEPEQCTS